MTLESDCCDSLAGSRRLRNEELIARVRRLAREDRALTARLLVHVGEVDARGLFRDEAFTSMYAFMVEGLGMSEGEAGLRLCAARVVRRFPRVLELFAAHELHLSAIKLLSTVLNEDNHEVLIAAARGQTRAGVELLLAKHFPKPDIADSIRKLPSRSNPGIAPQPKTIPDHAPSVEVRLEHGAPSAEGGDAGTAARERHATQLAALDPSTASDLAPGASVANSAQAIHVANAVAHHKPAEATTCVDDRRPRSADDSTIPGLVLTCEVASLLDGERAGDLASPAKKGFREVDRGRRWTPS